MTDVLAPVARQLFLNPSTGAPYAGAKIFTYGAGGTSKLATYTDSTGGTPNANPIILDSLGECDIWIPVSTAYKFVFSPPTDTDPPTNAIWTRDQIQVLSTSVTQTLAVGGATLGANAMAVSGLVQFHGRVSNDLGGFLENTTIGYVQTSFGQTANFLAAGIGVAAAGPVDFTVTCTSGGVRLPNGATAWVAVSERAKKKDIEPITGALEIISHLEAATGLYIEDEPGTQRRPFLFYEDFEEYWPYPIRYVPERTHVDEGTGEKTVLPETKGLSKEEVVPLLVAAIQELMAEVRKLREDAGLA